MARGIIEGKEARKYDVKFLNSKRSKLFTKFFEENIIGKNLKICDLCCGSGNMIEILKNRAKEIVGIDASSEMIKICKEKIGKNKKINFVLASATKINEKDNYFDYVLIRNGLHHLKDKKMVLKEAHRVLKATGKLVVVDRYYINKFYYYFESITKLIFKFDKNMIGHHMLSKQQNIDLFKEFKLVKEEYFSKMRNKSVEAYLFVLVKK